MDAWQAPLPTRATPSGLLPASPWCAANSHLLILLLEWTARWWTRSGAAGCWSCICQACWTAGGKAAAQAACRLVRVCSYSADRRMASSRDCDKFASRFFAEPRRFPAMRRHLHPRAYNCCSAPAWRLPTMNLHIHLCHSWTATPTQAHRSLRLPGPLRKTSCRCRCPPCWPPSGTPLRQPTGATCSSR